MGEGSYHQVKEAVSNHPASYSGLAAGTGTETASVLGNVPIMDYLNPWHGDKLLHTGFSAGLTHLTHRGMEHAGHRIGTVLETISQYTDNGTVSRYLDQAADIARSPSFRTKLVGSAFVVAGFSLAKEYGPETGVAFIDHGIDLFADGSPDPYDIAANYAGWAAYNLSQYGLDNAKEEATELGQQIYDTVR